MVAGDAPDRSGKHRKIPCENGVLKRVCGVVDQVAGHEDGLRPKCISKGRSLLHQRVGLAVSRRNIPESDLGIGHMDKEESLPAFGCLRPFLARDGKAVHYLAVLVVDGDFQAGFVDFDVAGAALVEFLEVHDLGVAGIAGQGFVERAALVAAGAHVEIECAGRGVFRHLVSVHRKGPGIDVVVAAQHQVHPVLPEQGRPLRADVPCDGSIDKVGAKHGLVHEDHQVPVGARKMVECL